MVAVAPIIVIMVALLAILIYYAAEWLGKVIIQWTPDIHLPGLGSLRGLVEIVVHTGVDLVRAVLYPVVHPFVQLVEGAAVWVARIIGGVVSLTHQAAAALHEVRTVIIPNLADRLRDFVARAVAAATVALGTRIHDLRDWTANRLGDLRNYAAGLVAAATVALGTRIHDLRDWTENAIGDVRTWTVGRIAALDAAIAHDLSVLRTWTAQHVLRLDAKIADTATALEADIAAGVKHAIHAVDVDLVQPLENVWEGLGDDVAALEGVIASDFPDIGNLLKSLDLSKLIDLLGVSGLSLVMSRVLARYLRECGVPTCRNTAGWARGIFDVLEAIGDASLLALFVAMVTEPEATAHVVDDVLGGLARPFVGEVQSLLGV